MITEVTITSPSQTQYLRVLKLAKLMELDLSNSDKQQFKVAIWGEQVIGFIRLKKSDDFMELATLGVVKSFRNKGVGELLIQYFTEKYSNLHLISCIPQFFEKWGFKRVSEVPINLMKKFNNKALWEGYGEPVVLVNNPI